METILFVPQTKRNFELLKLYSSSINRKYHIVFLATKIFGENCYIGSMNHAEDSIIEKDFLNVDMLNREINRLLYMHRHSKALVSLLREINPKLVVVGVDGGGFGLWVTSAAKKIGIPTIACQEGAYRIFAEQYPLSIRLKVLVLKLLTRTFFRENLIKTDFITAKYAALWGEFDKNAVINNGKSPANIFIVGDPRVPVRTNLQRPITTTILFLDAPFLVFAKGRFKPDEVLKIRKRIIEKLKSLGQNICYKIHPHTTEKEIEQIRFLINGHEEFSFICEGSAENFISAAHICISFPSTSVFYALAVGTPFIILNLPLKGFGKLLWNPQQRHNAGLVIQSIDELDGAIKQANNEFWRKTYYQNSLVAAKEVVGALDGKASERFAEVIKCILNNPNV